MLFSFRSLIFRGKVRRLFLQKHHRQLHWMFISANNNIQIHQLEKKKKKKSIYPG